MKMNVAHLPELKKFHHITVTKFLRKVFQVEKHGLQSFEFWSLFCKICGAVGPGDARFLGNGKTHVAHLCNLSYLIRQRQDH